jgi:exopolysaccharide production protein ExoZ
MSITPTSEHKHTYTGIQALRFVAAMLVVLAHSTAMVNERMHLDMFKWRAGWSGVDIFFVISGFVMAISSGGLMQRVNGWKIFITRRLIRIVPLYWVATTIKLVAILVLPSLALDSPLELWNTIASYLFIPTFDDKSLLAAPLLKVGWTLNYEMLFYAIFTMALLLGKSPLKFTAAIFALAVAINIFSTPSVPFLYGFLEPILMEFVMGMLVAKLCMRVNTINAVLNIDLNIEARHGAKNFIDKLLQYISTTKVGAIIGAIAVLASFTIMFNCAEQPMWWRWAYWGLPSMVIVTVVALSEPALRKVIPKLLATLGDSSYSLYLFHTFTVPLLGTLMIKMKLVQPTLALTACIVISPLVCLAIYAWFELPMTTRLKKWAQFKK